MEAVGVELHLSSLDGVVVCIFGCRRWQQHPAAAGAETAAMADNNDGVAAKFSCEKGHGWLIVKLCSEGEEEEGKGLLSWLFGRGMAVLGAVQADGLAASGRGNDCGRLDDRNSCDVNV